MATPGKLAIVWSNGKNQFDRQRTINYIHEWLKRLHDSVDTKVMASFFKHSLAALWATGAIGVLGTPFYALAEPCAPRPRLEQVAHLLQTREEPPGRVTELRPDEHDEYLTVIRDGQPTEYIRTGPGAQGAST